MKQIVCTSAHRWPVLLTLPLAVLFAIVSACRSVRAQQQQSPAEIERRVDAFLAKLTLKQKVSLLGGVDSQFIRAIPEIGLPRLKMSDGPMGVRQFGRSISYAAGIGLAASWDVNLARRVGVSMGRDARARGVNFLLGPGVNIYRLPMDGRNFEFYGEDPYLASRIAVALIKGVQSQDVAATIKHYDANNSEYDRYNIDSIISRRALREIYLPVFEAAVKQAHVGAIMASYNLINGEHATQNKFLDTTVLRKDWGFRGILMSDWGATHNGIDAANAGLDLEMPWAKFMNAKALLPAIKEGKVSVATINEKVRHILYVAVKFGFLNHIQTDLRIPLYDQQSRHVALESAEGAMVLLKNEGHLLPLDMSKIHTLAVIGPDAYPAETAGGGSAHVIPFAPVSFMTGLSDSFAPGTKVLWNQGVRNLSDLLGPQKGSNARATAFSTDAQGRHLGLTQEEFDNATFAGKPVRVSVVRGVRYWGGSPFAPASHKRLAVRWVGYYTPKTSGPQEFVAASIALDSYRLYVDGKLVLRGLPGRGEPQSTVINLSAGQAVPVRFDYLPDTSEIRAGFDALPAADMLEPNVRKIADMADVVVLSVGFDPETEGEGHDRTYALPPGQVELIKAVTAANPRTVLVLTAGGSVATAGWLNRVPVFLQTWYGGSEAGDALAAVLTGRVNPSGRLPITWWKRVQDNPAYANYYEPPGSRDVIYREGVFLGYRAYGRKGQYPPLYPFGYGLSYTTFAFSHLTVSPKVDNLAGPIAVSFDVRNTGRRAGSAVAEVYVSDPSATTPRPEEELKGFERVTLAPGETKRARVMLDRRSLAYWDSKTSDWRVDPGAFVISVGSSSENLPLTEKFTVQ